MLKDYFREVLKAHKKDLQKFIIAKNKEGADKIIKKIIKVKKDFLRNNYNFDEVRKIDIIIENYKTGK